MHSSSLAAGSLLSARDVKFVYSVTLYMRYVLSGDVEVISEEHIDDWYILKLTSDYTGTGFAYENNRANYIIMFDEVRGFFLEIGGTLDIEVLGHIADEIEITESNVPQPKIENSYSENIGCIDVGRG